MDGKVPRSILDTRGMGERESLVVWQEAIDVLYDAQPRDGAAEPFCVEGFLVKDVVLTRFRGGAQSFDRSRARIGRDGQDQFMLQLLVDGSWSTRTGDRQAAGGDIVIMDMAQPQSMACTSAATMHLCVPRRLLAPRLNAPDEHNMRAIRGTEPLAALFRAHLATLIAYLPELTVSEAEAALAPTLELAATAINGTVREEARGAVQFALIEQIRRHVDAHIAEPDLTIERIAGQFGLSRRKLSYLFEAYGGLASHIQRKRLHLIRAALADPRQRDHSIREIAENFGFTHYRSFVRAFHRLFELTPREARALAAERRSILQSGVPSGAEWACWLHELR